MSRSRRLSDPVVLVVVCEASLGWLGRESVAGPEDENHPEPSCVLSGEIKAN